MVKPAFKGMHRQTRVLDGRRCNITVQRVHVKPETLWHHFNPPQLPTLFQNNTYPVPAGCQALCQGPQHKTDLALYLRGF